MLASRIGFAVMSQPRAIIAGTGHHVPEKVVTNFDLEKVMNTNDEFIRTRTGVIERRHAEPHETLADLIKPAAEAAIRDAGLHNADIDLLLVNSLSPDYHDPSQACLVQPMLGLRHVPSFDIRAQCSGVLYGLDLAQMYIRTGAAENVLVVCAELLSKRMDHSDAGRNLSILLGDGAGAMVVRASRDDEPEREGLVDLIIGADGKFFDLLATATPGAGETAYSAKDDELFQFRMQGRPMFEHASATLASVAKEILDKHGLTSDDIDLLIPHQPNMRILDEVQKRLEVPVERIEINVDKFGNMASASLPITLDIARRKGRMTPGTMVMLLAYGAGATWGAALYRA